MKCFACDRAIKANAKPKIATTSDGQRVYVGPDCYRKIISMRDFGFQPKAGGPVLYWEGVKHK